MVIYSFRIAFGLLRKDALRQFIMLLSHTLPPNPNRSHPQANMILGNVRSQPDRLLQFLGGFLKPTVNLISGSL